MEKQIQSFAGTPAGSILIALGIGVYAAPFAVKYLIKTQKSRRSRGLSPWGGTSMTNILEPLAQL